MMSQHNRHEQTHQPGDRPAPMPNAGGQTAARLRERVLLVLFWSYVLIPLAWGIKSTVQKALLLFH